MNRTYEDKINRAEEIYAKRLEERKLKRQNELYNNYLRKKNNSNNNSSININNKNKDDNFIDKNRYNEMISDIAEYNIKNNKIDDNNLYKKNNIYDMNEYLNKNNNKRQMKKKNRNLRKKIIKFIWKLLKIYIIVLLIQNRTQIFNDKVINNIDKVLDYNINIINFCKSYINKENKEDKDSDILDNENIIEKENMNSENNTLDNNLEIINNINLDKIEQNDNQNNEQKELEILRKEYLIPVDGIVTSEFGTRESVLNNISKNHKGIDIGTDENKKIVAAMAGVVKEVKYSNTYGNMLKIENIINEKKVVNLYAHCKEIYVHINDYINKGQEIALVGSTGNSTGPHLHFEVIYDGEYINPREVLNI